MCWLLDGDSRSWGGRNQQDKLLHWTFQGGLGRGSFSSSSQVPSTNKYCSSSYQAIVVWDCVDYSCHFPLVSGHVVILDQHQVVSLQVAPGAGPLLAFLKGVKEFLPPS